MKKVSDLPSVAARRLEQIDSQNELLVAIVADSNDVIASFTLEGLVTSWNKTAERIFGYSADEIIGKPGAVLLPPEKVAEAAENLERFRQHKSFSHFETSRLAKDGNVVSISLFQSPIYDLNRVLIGVSEIWRDITILKKSETQRALLAAIVASSDDAISSESLDGIITSWNSAAERMFGYTADEIVGRSFLILAPSGNMDEAIDILGKIRNGQPISKYETVRLKKDGSAVPVSMTFSPIYDPTGAINGVSVICQDLTEHKKSEMQKSLLAAIVLNSNDTILSFTLDGIITSWNSTAELTYGYSADEIVGKSISILVPFEMTDDVVHILSKVKQGQSISNYKTIRLTKDGRLVPVTQTLSPIYDSIGAVIGGSAICRNMTEMYDLEKRNMLLAIIVESSNDAIWSSTIDGIVTSWNPAAERLYGHSAAEIIGQPFSVIVPFESKDETARLRQLIIDEMPIKNYEVERLRKDGTVVSVSLNISPIYDLSGAVIGSSTITRDLTESKKSEMQTKLLAGIVANSNDAITSFTLDGIVTSWNPAAERLYGYTSDEIIGQPAAVLLPSERAAEAAEILKNLNDGQPISVFETLRNRKDGSSVPISLSISPIYDPFGVVIGGSSIYRDLTEFKRAEQKFQTIVESASDAIVITDSTGIITIVNSKTEEIFGYRREELLGQPVGILVPNQFPAYELGLRVRNMSQILDQRREFEVQTDFYARRKDGRKFPIEVCLNKIEFADGLRISVAIRDVTADKNLIRKLQEMNELRSEFVAIVAHDLRSPMTSISGYAQELLDQWDTTDEAEKIRYLQVIVRNTEHLAKFVEDVLQVARIDEGKYSYHIRQFDIRLLTQRALNEAASASDDRQFDFKSPENLPNVIGDEDRQWQVLTNLISNAVKFSHEDEPVVVELTCIDDSVQVSVADRGIGIATDDLQILFTKFGRVSTTGARKISGNGLGLYICKTLVEAQGGRIWCESSPGRGSTFTFTIPIAT